MRHGMKGGFVNVWHAAFTLPGWASLDPRECLCAMGRNQKLQNLRPVPRHRGAAAMEAGSGTECREGRAAGCGTGHGSASMAEGKGISMSLPVWIVCTFLMLLSLWVGYLWGKETGWRAGIESKIPDESLPCGHKRNPHQWGKWQPWGTVTKFDKPVGIVQSRSCPRCGFTEFDEHLSSSL